MGIPESPAKSSIPLLVRLSPSIMLATYVLYQITVALSDPGAGAAGSAGLCVILLAAAGAMLLFALVCYAINARNLMANVVVVALTFIVSIPVSIYVGNLRAEQRQAVADSLVRSIRAHAEKAGRVPSTLAEIGTAEAELNATGDIGYPSKGFRYLPSEDHKSFVIQYESFASIGKVYSSDGDTWRDVDLH